MIRIRILWKTVCRMVWWGWKMRNNHDWDFAYLYLTIHLKLQRMDKVLFSEKSYALWTIQDKSRVYRALKETKEIARRLSTGEEHYKYTLQFHEKYGFKGSLASLFDERLGVEKISDNLYNKLYRAALKKDEAHYKQLKQRFYYLLSTFGEHWWD
jgi:hypothetical protein